MARLGVSIEAETGSTEPPSNVLYNVSHTSVYDLSSSRIVLTERDLHNVEQTHVPHNVRHTVVPPVATQTSEFESTADSADSTSVETTNVPNRNTPKRNGKKKKMKKKNFTSLFPFPLPPRTGRRYRFFHQNANGLRARLRDGSFFKALEEENPDVVAITEARCTRKQFLRTKKTRARLRSLGYHFTAFHTSTNKGYAGVAVISKLPFSTIEIGLDEVDAKLPVPPPPGLLKELQAEARVLLAEFGHFRVAVVYSPNSGKPGDLSRLPKRILFEKLLQHRLGKLDMPFVLVGDLNAARDETDVSDGLSHPRYTQHPGCTDQERALLEQLIDDNHLVDLQQQQGEEGFTYYNSRGYAMRLDYVLVHEALQAYIQEFQHIKGMSSDHSGQTFEIDRSLFDLDTLDKPLVQEVLRDHLEPMDTADKLESGLRSATLLDELDSKGHHNPVVAPLVYNETTSSASCDAVHQSLLSIVDTEALLAADTDGLGQVTLACFEDLLAKHADSLLNIAQNATYECRVNEQYESAVAPPPFITERPRKVSLINVAIDMHAFSTDGSSTKLHPVDEHFPGIGDSGCSTSCIEYRALCSRYGTAAVDEALFKAGYNPIFQVADGNHVASLGQIAIQFSINGVHFWHVFCVMPKLAHPFILGNNFLEQAEAAIDYKKGLLTLYNALGQAAQVPFKINNKEEALSSLQALPQRESALLAKNDITIPAFSSVHVKASPRESDTLCSEAPFGVVSPHWRSQKAQTPFGVMQLRRENLILLSNFTSSPIRVRKGTPVALFVEVSRKDVDLYAADLDSMQLLNLESIACCPCDNCQEDKAEILMHIAPGHETHDCGTEPRDKFVPFENDNDEHLSHHPRFTKEEVKNMSKQQIDDLFTNTFLKDTRYGASLSNKMIAEIKEIILENRDVFGKNTCPGLANHAGVHIDTGQAQPTGFPLRPTMPKLRPIIDKHLDVMLEQDIISPSSSPWSAAVLMVPKKGGEFRFAIDYRRLNAVTTRDSYPLPRIDDALASLAGNKYFTTCDALAGFWNLPMADEESREKTAFRCHRGSFQFNRLPFGLVNAPAAFQRYMDIAMSGLNFKCALVYLDDILVFSKTWEDHKRDLNAVFECVRKAGLHLKLKKCTFGANSVDYLGHVICEQGVRPSPTKTAVINDFNLEPNEDSKKARKRLRSWLGLASYYRKYVPHFASLTEPLQRFIHSRQPYKGLTPELKSSITAVKAALTSEPILAHPDFDRPFEIHCDASPYAIGGTLVQHDDIGEKVIMYVSRSLKKHERNYHHYEKEALALFWCVKVFRPYVLGTRFKVVSDNKALLALFKKDPDHRMIRWVLSLQQYDIEYCYRAGKKHGDADALSRAFTVPSWVSFEKDDDVEALHAIDPATSTFSQPPWAGDTIRRISVQLRARLIHDMVRNNAEKFEDVPCDDITTHKDTNASSDVCSTSCNAIIEETQEGRTLNIDLPTRAELIAAQKEDLFLSRVRKRIAESKEKCIEINNKSARGKFIIKDDIVYRHVLITPLFNEKKLRKSDKAFQICVPHDMRRAVLYSVHGLEISGHDGVARTQARLSRHFWWPKVNQDCKAWVQSCLYCQRRKRGRPWKHGPYGSLQAQRPFDLVSFDIVGKLPETNDGNEYLLTVIDHFSRYPLAIPIPDRSLKTVVSALHTHLVCVFGTPRLLLSDREKSFASSVTKALFAKLGIKKIETSGYQPQANGTIERFHRFLNAALTMVCNDHKNDWDEHVDSVLFAYRTSLCTSTGVSPFEALFGRSVHAPPDILYDLDPTMILGEAKHGVQVSQSLQEAVKNIRKQQLKIHLANKDRVNKKRKFVSFEPGDLVMYYDHSFDTEGVSKLQWLFSGPHQILRKCAQSDNLYWIRKVTPNGSEDIKVNVNRLFLATNECEALGFPALGWESTDPVRAQATCLPPELPDHVHRDNIVENDFVALRVQPDEHEALPFAVGKVIGFPTEADNELLVWWYGPSRKGCVTGTWKPGYVDPRDNKRYYNAKKLRDSHKRYTSFENCNLKRENIVGIPFQLSKGKRIPKHILRLISQDESVQWKLPQTDLNALFSFTATMEPYCTTSAY